MSRQAEIAGIIIAVGQDVDDAYWADQEYTFEMPDDLEAAAVYDMAEPEDQTKAFAQAGAVMKILGATN